MRVCHVIESASAGSATILAGLALEAVRSGHEVHVVYSPGREDPRIIAAMREGGVASLTASRMRRAIGPWDLADGLALRQVLASLGKLDVIHSHSSKAGALTRTFGRLAGAAQVYSPHGFYTMTGEAPFYIGPVERALALLADRIIAVSLYEYRHALELGIAARRVAIVANGIASYEPMPRMQARRALGIKGDGFVVGFVGRLADQKNPLDAIRAVSDIQRGDGPCLAMIGDGVLRGEAEALAGSLQVKVRFCGPVNARPLYRAFDVLLCTSRYEGMAVTFLEALHCGVPIVSYPVGGTEELVNEGTTGFVVQPHPEVAARAVETLMSMPADQREQMARACRAIGAYHSDVRMGEETLAVYAQVLADRA